MKDEEAACLRESRPRLRVVVCWQIIHNTSSYPLGIYHLVGNNERKNLFSTFTNKWIDNLTQLCRRAAVFLRKIMIIIILIISLSLFLLLAAGLLIEADDDNVVESINDSQSCIRIKSTFPGPMHFMDVHFYHATLMVDGSTLCSAKVLRAKFT